MISKKHFALILIVVFSTLFFLNGIKLHTASAQSQCGNTQNIRIGQKIDVNNASSIYCYKITGYSTNSRTSLKVELDATRSNGEFDLYIVPGASVSSLGQAYRYGPISGKVSYAISNRVNAYTIAVSPRISGSFSLKITTWTNNSPGVSITGNVVGGDGGGDDEDEAYFQAQFVPNRDDLVLYEGESISFPFYLACPGHIQMEIEWQGPSVIIALFTSYEAGGFPLPTFASPLQFGIDFNQEIINSSHNWQLAITNIDSSVLRISRVEVTYPSPNECWAMSGLDYESEANFGEVSLNAGFTPDPITIATISGGDVDVGAFTELGLSEAGLPQGCYGFATRSPDFRLYWGGSSSRLRVYFQGDGDTTLIINGPDGSWSCNDDAFSLNPEVDFNNPLEGQYDIWIGSFNAGENITGTLYISEGGSSNSVLNCSGFDLPSRLSVGITAYVTPGDPNYLNAQPARSTALGNSRMDLIPGGDSVYIIGGPVCANRILWWEVEWNGLTGWTGEGTGDTYWMEP